MATIKLWPQWLAFLNIPQGTYFHVNLSRGSKFFISNFVWFLQRIALNSSGVTCDLLSCLKKYNGQEAFFTSSNTWTFHFRSLLMFRPSNLALVTSSRGFPLSNIGLKIALLFAKLILSSLHLYSNKLYTSEYYTNKLYTSEYLKDHTLFEMWRKIWRYDW